MVLCFGSVTKTVDNALVFHLLLNSACTVPRLSPLPTLPTTRMLGLGKRLGGIVAGAADQGDIPCHIVSCPAIKPGRLAF